MLLAGINLLGLFPAPRRLRLPPPTPTQTAWEQPPALCDRPSQRADALRTPADHTAGVAGYREPLERRTVHALFQSGHRTPHAEARRIGRSLGTALCPNGQSRRRGAGVGVRRRYALSGGCPLRHDRQRSALGSSAVSLIAGADYACPRGKSAAQGTEHRGADGAGSYTHSARYAGCAKSRRQRQDQGWRTAGVQYAGGWELSAYHGAGGASVRWTISAEEKSINGCNYTMVIPRLDLSLSFLPGENVLEFTPAAAGTIPYSCWMGMIRSTITVTE